MRFPQIYEQNFRPRCYLVNDQVYVRGRCVTIVPDTASPAGPETTIRAGTVLVRIEGQDRFVVATDPRAAQAGSAEVTSKSFVQREWRGAVITASLSLAEGLGISVQLDDTIEEVGDVAAQLNQDPVFRSHFVADATPSNLVRVRTRTSGGDAFLHVGSSLLAAFGPLGTAGVGSDPEVVVTDSFGELRDYVGRPRPAMVPALVAGHFREQNLIALTPAARRVLVRRGSLFS